MNLEPEITTEDQKKIGQGIREKYARVADSPQGLFRYPTGRAGLETLGYDPEIMKTLPARVLDSFCGVGNPFRLGPVSEGLTVLDIGCGGGLDCLVAARMAGPEGKVVGLDFSSEMISRAKENLQASDLTNVTFLVWSGEPLPFPENSFDRVISNGVFNLIPDKPKALQEVFRVLKPEGRLMMADQILTGEAPRDHQARIESWFR
ncbi:MAG: methyltransferase type 11 [Desulfobacca sp.]|nr:methyltransferase type 11 [Desulfobacca sp.]